MWETGNLLVGRREIPLTTGGVSSVRMPDIYFDFKMKCINHMHAFDMTEELLPLQWKTAGQSPPVPGN